MNIVKTLEQYDDDCVYFCEPIKNNIMNDGYFIRIIYSTPLLMLNGIYISILYNLSVSIFNDIVVVFTCFKFNSIIFS